MADGLHAWLINRTSHQPRFILQSFTSWHAPAGQALPQWHRTLIRIKWLNDSHAHEPRPTSTPTFTKWGRSESTHFACACRRGPAPTAARAQPHRFLADRLPCA